MIKAHKIRLNPTPEQEQYFWKAAGVARFAFNWGLAEYNKRKAAGQTEVKIVGKGECLIKEFVIVKSTEFSWVEEVSAFAYVGAFTDLKRAVSNYYDCKKKGDLKPIPGRKPRKDGQPFGWPRFKAKDKTTPGFYEANKGIKFNANLIKMPRCPGWIDAYEKLRFNGKVMGARVSYYANHWWLSVQVEVAEQPAKPLINDVVGVDLGIKYLAVTADGKGIERYDNPKPLYAALKKLARLQRSFARMEKGGKNWLKMKQRIAKLHYRIACIRNEASHRLTTELANTYAVIGLEDLNVKGMLQNRRLSKAIADVAFYEKRRQFEYKSKWNGGEVLYVDRWFPSSKLCSSCGVINPNLTLSNREWTCNNCQALNQRDDNAATNIRNEVIKQL